MRKIMIGTVVVAVVVAVLYCSIKTAAAADRRMEELCNADEEA